MTCSSPAPRTAKGRSFFFLVSALVVALLAPASHAQVAVTSRTREYVETLASERFQGRGAGSEGERLAGDYIAAQLQKVGAKPLPSHADMFRSFGFTGGSHDGGSEVTVLRGSGAAQGATFRAKDIQALAFSDDGELTAPVVFAGYGIVVPESQKFGYDSYTGLDIKDKIVVVLRYFPEDADQATRAILARYADLRYKALAARQRGAKALLVVTGPRSPNAGQVVPMTFDTALAGSGLPAASISGAVADAIFTGQQQLVSVQKDFDTGNPHVAGFAVPDVSIRLKTSVVREKQTGRNVLAYLPATEPTTGVAKPWIVVGAHYDHLGRGEHGNTLAAGDQVGKAHLGADDNASGTAAVLAVADTIAKLPRRTRHVLVAFWSAEEIGLVGSNAFVGAPPVPIDQMAAYLNFDMVGRLQDNKLAVQAAGSSPVWPGLIEQANATAKFELAVQPDPYQPTDVASFNQAGVPCLTFTTGAHADYHKPSDSADKIAYEGLDRIAAFGADIVRRLMEIADAPAFTKVEQSQQTTARTGVRVSTGTIPDYASDVKGLLLGGVVGGGPAERAGLQKGDVIVEIGTQAIANIYDYTYALELLKVGQPVNVVYLRNGDRKETTLTPAARK